MNQAYFLIIIRLFINSLFMRLVFQDVHTMIYIGFGFLMTFLKKYSYSAVGLNLFLAAVAAEWSILVYGCFNSANKTSILVNVPSLINAEFAAATILISFGAVLGKTSPTQLLFMILVEVVLAKLNEFLCLKLQVYY